MERCPRCGYDDRPEPEALSIYTSDFRVVRDGVFVVDGNIEIDLRNVNTFTLAIDFPERPCYPSEYAPLRRLEPPHVKIDMRDGRRYDIHGQSVVRDVVNCYNDWARERGKG